MRNTVKFSLITLFIQAVAHYTFSEAKLSSVAFEIKCFFSQKAENFIQSGSCLDNPRTLYLRDLLHWQKVMQICHAFAVKMRGGLTLRRPNRFFAGVKNQ